MQHDRAQGKGTFQGKILRQDQGTREEGKRRLNWRGWLEGREEDWGEKRRTRWRLRWRGLGGCYLEQCADCQGTSCPSQSSSQFGFNIPKVWRSVQQSTLLPVVGGMDGVISYILLYIDVVWTLSEMSSDLVIRVNTNTKVHRQQKMVRDPGSLISCASYVLLTPALPKAESKYCRKNTQSWRLCPGWCWWWSLMWVHPTVAIGWSSYCSSYCKPHLPLINIPTLLPIADASSSVPRPYCNARSERWTTPVSCRREKREQRKRSHATLPYSSHLFPAGDRIGKQEQQNHLSS